MNKNIVIILLIFSLSSLNAIKPRTHVSSQGPTVVNVVPSLIEYHTNATGQQFTVAVRIENVVNLYGFDIKFRWNTTYLEYVSHSVRVPKDDYPDGILYKPIIDVMDQVNITGTYWLAKTSRWPAPSFNGSGTAFTITFRIKKHPVQPQPTANLTLELYEVELAAIGGDTIPHIKQNGEVILYALTPPLKHDIAIININPLKTIVGQDYTMNINVTVTNQGDFTETFNVTLYANTTAIQTKEITLQRGTSTTLIYIWNTTGFAKGNYTLWAYAWPVPGETYIDDNTFTDGFVFVAMVGDINADGKVDMKDVAIVSKAFGSIYIPGQGYMHPTPCSMCPHTPNADINNDQKIDMKDIAIVSKQFGKIDP